MKNKVWTGNALNHLNETKTKRKNQLHRCRQRNLMINCSLCWKCTPIFLFYYIKNFERAFISTLRCCFACIFFVVVVLFYPHEKKNLNSIACFSHFIWHAFIRISWIKMQNHRIEKKGCCFYAGRIHILCRHLLALHRQTLKHVVF